MKLSKRLERVAAFAAGRSQIPAEKTKELPAHDTVCPLRIADIGTDHGYVPIALALENPDLQALALDVRPGPLKRAEEHIARYGLQARIRTRLSDGASALRPGEADVIIIAGMGGELILHILEGGRHLWPFTDRWILSPQSELSKVRRYLKAQNFTITREDLVEEDDKYYPIIEAVHGRVPGIPEDLPVPDEAFEEVRCLYGPRLIEQKHPVLLRLLRREETKLTAILNQLKTRSTEKARTRSQELNRQLAYITRAIKEITLPDKDSK
ncbi:MAG: SAM-dependent methyltransferase [Hungatella sp.]|nr:SAM-dependent methyltransferase [Hungatella sp.]